MNGAVRLVCLAMSGALAASACARAGRYRDWGVSRSRNVAVYTDAKLEHEFIQEWLELSHAALQAFFPTVKTGTVDVVWLKNQPGTGTRFYRPFDDPRSGWTLERLPSSSDGRIGRDGLIVLERNVVSGPGLSFTAVRDETLAKEQMAHLFIMKAVPMAPLWLQVGLGRYLQKYRIHYQGNFWLACFGSPVFDEPTWAATSRLDGFGRLRPGITGNGRRVTLSLAQVLETDWYGYDGRHRRWFEYTAYALVHYLIHGENGWHRGRFPLLLDALRAGKSQRRGSRPRLPPRIARRVGRPARRPRPATRGTSPRRRHSGHHPGPLFQDPARSPRRQEAPPGEGRTNGTSRC